MTDLAIRVENLGKQYRIGAAQKRHSTLRDAISDFGLQISDLFRINRKSEIENRKSTDTIWALKDVSFEVKRGEVVGIIGRNGAGKSTLLKILSSITKPTEGRVTLNGRVGSLLEVGTGFHAELTGRENIFLNGAILGMGKREIERKFDEIVAFAEVEKFIDTPVKHYSSGMYVRLAFAVAAHLEPEILVVDEVLAVGDAQFQKKCLGKMGDVAKEGRTVLFVSHNMVAIQSLCSRVLCLRAGNLVEDGMPHRVVANYMRDVTTGRLERTWDRESAPGNDLVKIQSVKILDESGKIPERLTINDSFWIETRFWNLRPGTVLGIAPHIFNQGGVLVFASVDFVNPDWGGKPLPVGLFSSQCHIPACLLNDGAYTITMLVYRDASVHVHWENEIIGFELHDTDDLRGNGYWKWPGVIRPSLEWKIEMVGPVE